MAVLNRDGKMTYDSNMRCQFWYFHLLKLIGFTYKNFLVFINRHQNFSLKYVYITVVRSQSIKCLHSILCHVI